MSPAALVALFALAAPAHEPTETCPADVVESFDRVDNALRHLVGEIAETRGRPEHREHLREDLVDALARSQAARVVACRAARVPVVVEAPRPLVLDDVRAQSLEGAVRKEAFDDSRLTVLTLGVRGVCVTSTQARDLVSELTFARPRIDAVRAVVPRIVDRSDAWRLFDAFTFESDKRAVKEILVATPPSPECTVAPIAPG